MCLSVSGYTEICHVITFFALENIMVEKKSNEPGEAHFSSVWLNPVPPRRSAAIELSDYDRPNQTP